MLLQSWACCAPRQRDDATLSDLPTCHLFGCAIKNPCGVSCAETERSAYLSS